MAMKSGTVAIIGRPSAGKSTFLNTACNEDVAIVSNVPQTTRDAIHGVVNTSLGQLVFVDTPGYHNSNKKLNLRLRAVTESAVQNSDALLYIIDCTRPLGEEEEEAAALAARFMDKCVIAVNKTDAVQNAKAVHIDGATFDDIGREDRPNVAISSEVLKVVHRFIEEHFPNLNKERIFDISARKDKGIDEVLRALYALSPNGEAMYGKDVYTDQDVKFRIEEIIRGEAINRLDEELPHCIYVNVADVATLKSKAMWVRAFIYVERESQKGILIGKGAAMIKQIRRASAAKCKKVFERKIDMDLQVKVDKNWRQKDEVLSRLIR